MFLRPWSARNESTGRTRGEWLRRSVISDAIIRASTNGVVGGVYPKFLSTTVARVQHHGYVRELSRVACCILRTRRKNGTGPRSLTVGLQLLFTSHKPSAPLKGLPLHLPEIALIEDLQIRVLRSALRSQRGWPRSVVSRPRNPPASEVRAGNPALAGQPVHLVLTTRTQSPAVRPSSRQSSENSRRN